MDSLDIHDLLCFMAGWHPPRNEFELSRSRWKTWKEYLADWVAVREECLASEPFQRGGPNFAEQVLNTYGAKGPPDGTTYDEMKVAFAATEDREVAELLRDLSL